MRGRTQKSRAPIGQVHQITLGLGLVLLLFVGVQGIIVPDAELTDQDSLAAYNNDHFQSQSYIPEAPTPPPSDYGGFRTNDTSINFRHVSFFETSPAAQLTLDERIELEKITWHWYPYRRINYKVLEDGRRIELFCEGGSAIDDLPDDLFTQEQRLQGAIVLHFIAAIYFFTFLAYTVGEYFLPSVECVCEDLKLTQDVAAATFMAIAGTIPEFFTNTISTFLTDSDMGIGTIMGSLLFNTLGVAALAGLATRKPVQLDWWPLTRDSLVFAINVSILVGFSWDGRIYWYEAMILFILLFVYFVVMFQNKHIMKVAKKYIEGKWNLCSRVIRQIEEDERVAMEEAAKQEQQQASEKPISTVAEKVRQQPAFRASIASILSDQMAETPMKAGDLQIPSRHALPDPDEHPDMTLWRISRETKLRLFWWFYSWPIRFLLTFTVPNPKTWRRWYPLTFFLCIVYIALCSFFTFWMMSIIGYTFGIPETVMGLTFLAMGGCMPEAVSAILVIRTGNGAMGVSNALGANSLSILFSLGMPWFIRVLADGASATNAYVVIASYGMQYSIISLLFAIASLYLVIYAAKYKLRKRIGLALFLCYGVLVTFMLLNELDVFFSSGNEC
ncbi:sodium/potassium/calcium exchanger 3-like [Uranotaenia lowii]|uniref:sodium/potassium/calcium exchanger 3-like n=1 Tax=Uranotaenia lowii TaxID=190385 RepID=UPI002479F943|nr:sodium/potassium/calcium exchanger 3-like [Uranotaenia lowii]